MKTGTTPNEIPKAKKGLYFFFRVILWLIGSLLLLFGIAFVTALALESPIKSKIIREINAEVTVPVTVRGTIDLSLIRHFPYASLTFRQVSIEDKLRKGKKLLNVQEFSFLCNIFSLFGKEVEFSRVWLKNGELNLYRNEQRQTNFDIFKDSKEESKSQLAFQLRKALIKNVRFRFTDLSQATDIRLRLKDAALHGNFNQAQFDLDATGKIVAELISANGQEYVRNKNIAVDVTLSVNKAKQRYSFTKGKIEIEKSAFSITGFFALLKNSTQVDFSLKNSGKDVQELFALLPENIRQSFADANGSGEYSLSADMKGFFSKESSPSIKVVADLKNSELRLSRYNKFLKKVNATARYEIDEKGNDKLVISNFNCTLNDLPFDFSLTLSHLANPSFDFYANGVLQLSEISSFIPDSVIQDMDGKIKFRNFHLTGQKSDFTGTENSTLNGSGEFEMEQLEFRQNGITYGNINGLLKYENQTIHAQNFTLNFLSTDLRFDGRIENMLAFAYNLSKKRTAGDVVLNVNGKLITHTFNLNGILEAYDKKNRPEAQQRQKINIRDIFNMQGNVEVEINKFLVQQMEFGQLQTDLQLSPGIIRINHLQASAMSGDIKANGLVSFTPNNDLNISCDITAVNMDIPQIFRECSNFGQTTLTDKNLKGTISTAISLNATWKNYKELDQDKLNAIIDFNIKNGELMKFEPLRAASKFIRVEELDDIRFADLSNTIRIADRTIDLPEFEIKSSALNLILSGHHHFNNTVDYHFKINLHKVLAQKFNRNYSEVQYIENDPYEGLNLYLTMTGPLNNPKINFDKPAARNKIKEDFKKQKEEFRHLMKGKPATTIDPEEKKREEKYFDVKEQPKFIDFDEEPK